MSGLEGLAGTPMRVASPSTSAAPAQSSNLDDLMGIFGSDSMATPAAAPGANGGSGTADLMNGFAGLDLSGAGGSQGPAQTSSGSQKKSNAELMDLF